MLPELELPKTFSRKKAKEIIARISSTQRRTLVQRRFEETDAPFTPPATDPNQSFYT